MRRVWPALSNEERLELLAQLDRVLRRHLPEGAFDPDWRKHKGPPPHPDAPKKGEQDG